MLQYEKQLIDSAKQTGISPQVSIYMLMVMVAKGRYQVISTTVAKNEEFMKNQQQMALDQKILQLEAEQV